MMFAVLLVAATAVPPKPFVPPMLSSRVQSVGSRAICVSRGRVVDGGTTNVVETWRRGNFTWSVTNAARRVFGVKQTNTLQERIDTLKAKAEEIRTKAEEWESKYQLKEKAINAQRTLLTTKRAAYVKLRDAALLSTTKAIYQKIIDEIDEQLANLDGDT